MRFRKFKNKLRVPIKPNRLHFVLILCCMDFKFDLLPPPNDSFSAPYGYYENLPERTLTRLHRDVHANRQPSPLLRFRWSGLAFLFVVTLLSWGQLSDWGARISEDGNAAPLEAALVDLPESVRIEYLLAHSPSPDLQWLTSSEMNSMPIIESEVAAELLEQSSAASWSSDYELDLIAETEFIDTP